MNHHILEVQVTLDTPITVFGVAREAMIVHAADHQSDLAHFLGGSTTDHLEVA
jgi:hypothetical protein